MARFSFEWTIEKMADAPEEWRVTERLVGTEHVNFYSVKTQPLAEAIVKARRAFCHRISTRAGALQVFEPRLIKGLNS